MYASVEKPCVSKIISNNCAFHIHTSIQATLIQLSATQSNKTAIKQKKCNYSTKRQQYRVILECAQCDQCAQPLSAGGRQRATCVHGRMKGTQHTRTHAARREAVNSAISQHCCLRIQCGRPVKNSGTKWEWL